MIDVTFGTIGADVRRVLRRAWWSHVAFDVVIKTIAASVLLPLSSWILARAVAATGRSAVSNADIAQFLLSPMGLTAGAAWVAAGVWSMLAEGVGHVAIAGGALSGKPLPTMTVTAALLRRWPRLGWMATLLTALIAVGVAPLLVVAVVAYRKLLAQFDLYFVVTNHPPQLFVWLAIVVPVALMTLWLFARYAVRWMLAMPAAVFGGARGIGALREGRRLSRGHEGLVLQLLVASVVLGIVLPAVIGAVFSAVGTMALTWFSERYALVIVTTGLLVVAYGIALAFASVMSIVWFSASSAGLYRRIVETDMVPSVEATPSATDRTRRMVLVAAAVAAVVSFVGTLGAIADVQADRVVGVTAHRGSSLRAPENTLSALYAAIADEADVVEIDVQETADGEIVVVHDVDLRRIADDPRGIWELPAEAIAQVDAGGWFGDRFAGERIPTLRGMLDAARGRIGLNVELKFSGHDVALVDRVVAVIKAQGTPDVVISSLDYGALQDVRRLAPEIPVGFIVASTITNVQRLDVDFLAVSTRLATAGFVRSAQRAGKQVHVWTVNDRSAMLRLIEMGVDNIMTDDPALLRQVLAERAALTDLEKLLLACRHLLWS